MAVRVLIVDDSKIARRYIRRELEAHPDLEVVGEAEDSYRAREKIVELNPDVLTLDLEMPGVNGLDFLRAVMSHRPMPVVVVSSIAPESGRVALEALARGAVDVVFKSGGSGGRALVDLAQTVLRASRANLAALKHPASRSSGRKTRRLARCEIIGIGSSTGGPVALDRLFGALPKTLPPIVIVQHLPVGFSALMAARLSTRGAVEVREVRDGEPLAPGSAYLAPGDTHLLVRRQGAQLVARLKKGPKVHYQIPAVDVLFASIARAVGGASVGVVLTGMGADGADGLLAMRKAGAVTIAQDRDTSVVYGMPRAAFQKGGVEHVRPLDQVAATIVGSVSSERRVVGR
ncbi:MAG: chemotaxis response regulator protein-glutamate methylesterase [Sandaracinaceae bacterium]